MNKKIKIIILIVLIILVCVICFFTFKNNSTEVNISADETNEINTNNVTNETNEIENEVISNEIENTNQEVSTSQPMTPTEIVPSSSVYESNTDVGTTNKKQEAIELVKQKWGEDSSVTFRCDSVTTDGEYIIAVVSLESASVRNYFKVNLETKTVTIDY